MNSIDINEPVRKIDLKIKRKESIFEGKILREKVDYKRLERLIRNPQLLIVNDDFNETIQLKDYLKIIKNGFVNVKYNRTNEIGRSYSYKSLSYQGIRKEVRSYLCNGYYMDLDMVNSHPVMLEQICRSNGLNCNYLTKYVNNREELLKMVMKTYGVSRSDSKTLFIRLLYLGKIYNWEKDLELDHKQQPFLLKFEEEMENISSLITNFNIDILDDINKKSKGKNKKNTGNFGCYFQQKRIKREDKESILPYYLQEYENRVLEVMYNYLKSKNYIEEGITTLCYDGIMVKKCDNIEEVLKGLNEVVKEELGFDIVFEEKPLDMGFKESDFKEEVDSSNKEEMEKLLNGRTLKVKQN